MNYEHNKKYFSATLFSKLAIVCWVITAIGAVVLFLRVFELWYICGIGGVIACVLGFVFSSYSMKDREYDEICEGVFETFKKDFTEYISGHINKGNAHNRSVDTVDETKVSLSSCFLYGEGVEVKRGSDTRLRTSEYAVTGCYFAPDALLVGYKMCSLVKDKNESFMQAYRYADIEKADTYRPDSLSELAEYRAVRLKMRDGSMHEFLKTDDAELDKLVSLTNTRVAQADAAEKL